MDMRWWEVGGRKNLEWSVMEEFPRLTEKLPLPTAPTFPTSYLLPTTTSPHRTTNIIVFGLAASPTWIVTVTPPSETPVGMRALICRTPCTCPGAAPA